MVVCLHLLNVKGDEDIGRLSLDYNGLVHHGNCLVHHGYYTDISKQTMLCSLRN